MGIYYSEKISLSTRSIMSSMNKTLRSIKLLREVITNWDTHPFSVPVIKTLEEIIITSNVVFFIGENGSGKSTLLEAIANNFGFSKEGGTKNTQFQTNQEDYIAKLADKLRLVWTEKLLTGYFLRAESFFNFASHLDQVAKGPGFDAGKTYIPYGGVSLHQQSHGQSFMALFQNHFHKKGFFLLDEPEAALSIKKQLTFLAELNEIVKNYPKAQFIIATHSPIILSFPNAQILEFKNGRISEITYENTEIYSVTKYFLNNKEKMFKELFDENV